MNHTPIRVYSPQNESNEVWWDAVDDQLLRGAISPEIMDHLMELAQPSGKILLSEDEADALKKWAQTLPGWQCGPGEQDCALEFFDITL